MDIKRIIKEEINDFGFVNDTPELNGVSFNVDGYGMIYTIEDSGKRYYVDVTWKKINGGTERSQYKRSVVMKLFRDGTWVPIV